MNSWKSDGTVLLLIFKLNRNILRQDLKVNDSKIEAKLKAFSGRTTFMARFSESEQYFTVCGKSYNWG